MKKWVFVLCFLSSCILFLLSGTLIGFSIYEKQEEKAKIENGKTPRKPSEGLALITSPIIGKVVDKNANPLKTKARIPSSPALKKAEEYKAIMIG